MQRTLLVLAGVVFLALPAAGAAGAEGQPAPPAYLVVRDAATDGGVTGKPVVTVVVRGFVLGEIAQEGAVRVYHLATDPGSLAAQATGLDVSRRAVTYRGAPGTEFSGSDFRFRAVGGVWRVVVYGSGVSLYAAGEDPRVTLRGSVEYPDADGEYSLNGGRFVSLPTAVVKRRLEAR